MFGPARDDGEGRSNSTLHRISSRALHAAPVRQPEPAARLNAWYVSGGMTTGNQDAYPLSFVRHKANVARRLAAGECGGSYGDAVLILSSAVSAIAAELFAGTRIDRKRFVQTWVRYADPALTPVQISVPLLAQARFESGDQATVRCLGTLRPQAIATFPAMVDTLVLDGSRSDASQAEVLAACSNLPVPAVREFSYPNVFYAEIRSGFVHEGDTTEFGSSHPGGTRQADISYANVINKPYRRIHFSLDWLCRLAESIAGNAAADVYKPRSALPKHWWVEGGSA